MALATHPSCAIDTGVRQVMGLRTGLLPAAADMFIGEVGVDPARRRWLRYRRRVAGLYCGRRAWA